MSSGIWPPQIRRSRPIAHASGACLLLGLAFAAPELLGQQCGVQRWNVKVGRDSQAAAIDLSSPTPTTIAFLTDPTRFPDPHPWPPPNRIAPEEMTYWTLDATLEMY